MKHIGRTCHLTNTEDAIAFYRREHTRVWPEVLKALRGCGVLDMRIYLVGNRLFMECDVVDDFVPARDWARYANAHPSIAEWEAFMATVLAPPPEAPPGERWIEIEPVFSLAAAMRASAP